MAEILFALCIAIVGGFVALAFALLLMHFLGIKLVKEGEQPRGEDHSSVPPVIRSSTPPPVPSNLATVATAVPSNTFARGPRALSRPAEVPKQPDGFLVRLLLDFQGERISIPLVFDEHAIADSLPLAPATLGAGAEGDEREVLKEIFELVRARGTPPTRFTNELFDLVPRRTMLFGSAAHIKGNLPTQIPIMPRIMGEIWFSPEGEAMFSARKGLSPAGLLVERVVAGDEANKPVTFSAAVPPMKIPDGGIIVRQIAGFGSKEAGHAPIPSGLAWEIVPYYS